MSTSTKSLSASYMSVRYGITEATARLFMHKIREAIKSNESHPIDGQIHVYEFVIGDKENNKPGRSYHSKKKKIVCALQLTQEGKVKRFYALKIKDYSAKSLQRMFEKRCQGNYR